MISLVDFSRATAHLGSEPLSTRRLLALAHAGWRVSSTHPDAGVLPMDARAARSRRPAGAGEWAGRSASSAVGGRWVRVRASWRKNDREHDQEQQERGAHACPDEQRARPQAPRTLLRAQ